MCFDAWDAWPSPSEQLRGASDDGAMEVPGQRPELGVECGIGVGWDTWAAHHLCSSKFSYQLQSASSPCGGPNPQLQVRPDVDVHHVPLLARENYRPPPSHILKQRPTPSPLLPTPQVVAEMFGYKYAVFSMFTESRCWLANTVGIPVGPVAWRLASCP